MSNECKTARNTIGLAIIILTSLLLSLSSCATSSCGNTWGAATNCPAYRQKGGRIIEWVRVPYYH